jgi:hypothetical protein
MIDSVFFLENLECPELINILFKKKKLNHEPR